MLSWPMTLTARASLKKRSTIFLSAENCGCRNLIATREPITGCSAMYTAPIPPLPSTRVTR